MRPEGRPSRLAGVDRTILGVTGAAALAGGTLLYAASRGWWDLREPGAPLLDPSVDASWGAAPERWALVAAVATLVAALAVVWVVHRVGRSRPRADVEHRLGVRPTPVIDLRDARSTPALDAPRDGADHEADAEVPVHVTVPTSVVERTAADIAAADPAVRSARADLLEASGGRRTIALDVEIPARVAVADVQRRLEGSVLPELRRCLGDPELGLEVRYGLATHGPSRAS